MFCCLQAERVQYLWSHMSNKWKLLSGKFLSFNSPGSFELKLIDLCHQHPEFIILS